MTIEDLDLAAPGPGEVEVVIEAAGLCHSDVHYLKGGLTAKTPIVLGHEGCGVVVNVGPGVARVSPGDRVVFLWRPRCGQCEFCLTGRPALCPLGKVHGQTNELLRGGTRLSVGGAAVHHLMGASCFAERAVVSEESLIVIDDDIPSEVAAIVGCAVVTGVGAVLNHVEEGAGSSVVVIGAGGLGLSAVLGAGLVGASRIVVADLVDERLEMAKQLGATHVVRSDRDDLAQCVHDITGGGARYVIDTTGHPGAIRSGFDALRPGGTAVLVGLGTASAEVQLPLNQVVQGEKRVVGSLYGSANTPVQIPRILDLYRSGRLPLDRLVDRTFSLEEVNAAVEYLRDGAVGRLVLLPSAPGRGLSHIGDGRGTD
jgi:Zn-dependent alcohol dehydrogenase